MSKKGISRDELPGVQGWLEGVLWDVRHGDSAHAGQTLIALLKGIQERTEVSCNFEGWPEEAVAKIDPFTFNPYRQTMTKPRPKHLTLRPAEVPRFLRPSGLVVIPCKVQPEHVGDGIYRILVGRGRWVTNELIERKFVAGKMISEMNVVDPLEEMMKRHCPCPLGGPGTEWVGREKFIPCVGCGLDSKTADASYVCLEDGTQIFRNGNVDKWTLKDPPNWKGYRFRPASQMPLWASRIRKTTTRVELRRVKTITDDEIKATGITPDRATDHPRGVWCTAFMAEFNARYPDAWDRDDYAWFVFYTDTLGKD